MNVAETEGSRKTAGSVKLAESVPARFARVVSLHGDLIALSTNRAKRTYAELDEHSHTIAGQILDRMQENAAPVALLMNHGPDLINGILATLKAGRIYVALDPKDSVDHLSVILHDSGSELILTDEANKNLASSLAGGHTRVLHVGNDWAAPSTSVQLPEVEADADAWLMYTSGSTGQPKGVFHDHRGVVHDAEVYGKLIDVSSSDRFSLLTSCSRAASTSALFTALLHGATLCPFDVRSEGLKRLSRWLGKQEITIYHSVPSIFRHFLKAADASCVFDSVRYVRLGGESVESRDLEFFRARFPGECRLMNSLSSTETGLICAATFDKHAQLSGQTVPVGHPVGDVELFLVDEEGRNPVEHGRAGRIGIRSSWLRQGYWRRPELTAQQFRPDPVHPTRRIFIMQDRARLLPDGSFEHLGRADRMIKVRGLRADLDDIERLLRRHDLVQDAALVALNHSHEGNRLVAFVVPATGAVGSVDWIRRLQALVQVPCRVSVVKELPRLSNGKIDRLELSRQPSRLLSNESDRRPKIETKIHRELRSIWESILDVRPVGPTDDFFALGGDSLTAMTMLAAVEKAFGVSLAVTALVDTPTVQGLADAIAQNPCLMGGDTLVGLRGHGDLPPLFCVPSAGSNAFEFRRLAASLSEDQPVFAFQSPGLDGRSCCVRSVPELAETYVTALREHQPHGPYYICGTSFGGVVAFEIAQHLEQQNEEVRFLGLLDCHSRDYPKPRKGLGLRNRLKLALVQFLPHGQRTRFTLPEFKSGFKERAKRWLIRRWLAFDSFANARVPSCPVSWRPLYVQESCFEASDRYRSKSFSRKIDLFRSHHQPPAELFEKDPLLGWGGVADGGVEVHPLPGHHSMYLRDSEIISVLAGKLSACLELRRNEPVGK